MVDHRRTPSQRAYRLPGWFFVLTGTLSLAGLVGAGWILVADPFAPDSPASSNALEDAPTVTPTATPSRLTATPMPDASADTSDERDGIELVILNATNKAGLAAQVADVARAAGWTVADVGNWPYPAAQNAVFYPDGHQSEAELLGEDLEIASVRPVRPGMSTDELTVILLNTP
jgi:hypothetical protein